jgi:ubiquinone/menaquinone biosynthesis C-methylase UbiE
LPELLQEDNLVVVDLACGTGAALHALRQRPELLCRVRKYIGIDQSAEMLAVAAQQLCDISESSRTPATWLCAPADVAPLPLADDSVDVVLCCSALHFMDDCGICIAEIQRILKPGGVALISDWNAEYLTIRIIEQYMRLTRIPTNKVLQAKELRALMARKSPQLAIRSCRTARLATWWGFIAVAAVKEGVTG